MITRMVWQIGLCLLVAGCALPGDQDLYERVEIAVLECPDEPVDYETQVFPVINTACGACHGTLGLGELTLSDEAGVLTPESVHAAIAEVSAYKNPEKLLVLSGSEVDSYFVDVLLQRDAPLMPAGGPALEEDSIQLVRCWVEQGAER